MLIISRMFFGWIAFMKQKKKQSLSLKFKVIYVMSIVFQKNEENFCYQETKCFELNAWRK